MNQQGLESFKAPTPSWYALTQHKGAIPGWKDALLQGSSKGVKPEWKGEDFAKDTLMSSSWRKYNSTGSNTGTSRVKGGNKLDVNAPRVLAPVRRGEGK